jgi:DNA repair protein RecO (recombination protein O)
MAAEQALALVVRGSDWSETSRIATLFSREHGKIRALAKGGRRLRSSFEAAFDLLSVIRIVFFRSRSGGLDLLTEAQLAERFPTLRANLNALYVGYYVAELLADGTQDYDPHPVLFDAAVSTLRSLETQGDFRSLVAAFELVWLRELGYSPHLESCAECGAAMIEAALMGGVPYSPTAGGVLCADCEGNARDRRLLAVPTWKTLRNLTANTVESQAEIRWNEDLRRELRALLGQKVSLVLGRRPRLLAYVDSL